MAKLQKVLVAYDGSPQSKEALHWAIYFSRKTGAAIDAVKVFEPVFQDAAWSEMGFMVKAMVEKYEESQKNDQQLMNQVREVGHSQEIEIHTAVLQGRVAQTLLDYAKKNGTSIIVTGTRGQGTLKQLVLGSVTHGLISMSDIPVLVVKRCPVVEYTGKSMILATMRRILVAYDGYPPSKAALSWAVELAKRTGAQITAVRVFEPFQAGLAYTLAESGSASRVAEKLREFEETNKKIMEEAKELAKTEGMEISTQLLNGSVIESLLGFAENQGVDMIVVGARGHGILDKLPLGSVPHGLVGLSPVPVMVAK